METRCWSEKRKRRLERVIVEGGREGGRQERSGARRLTEEEGALCLMEGPFVRAAHRGNGANRGAKLM